MEAGSIYKTLVVKEAREVVPGFKLLVFADGHGITYKAGQYLTLVYKTNHEELRRSYSICSSPDANEPLMIGVRRIENGFFSRWLVDAVAPGDALVTTGAGGFFIIPDSVDELRTVFLFAAGSGITPIYAILKTLLISHPGINVILVYSNRSPATTGFLPELLSLKALHPGRLSIEFLNGNNPDLLRARLHRELLMSIVKQFADSDFSRSLYFICGPTSYMRLCRYTLREMGVEEERIRQEDFVIQRPARPVLVPPDTRRHRVSILLGNQLHHFEVAFPDTILAAAKRNNISLPYSCEAGRCGNCVARCTGGEVWLSYNEVLTEKELSQGLTLTCVGHPVGGDVSLII